jgi:hypothetical protein
MKRHAVFILDPHDINEDVIGIYPQGDGMVKNYDYKSVNSVDHFSELKGRKCDFIPDLRYKLNRKAKPTDFISGCLGPGGDLVGSQKVYDIFKKFNLGPHQWFQASIEHKNKVIGGFHRLHFVYKLESEIVFSQSNFKYAGKTIRSIESYEDYVNYRKTKDRFGLARTSKTVVERSKFEQYDLFVIGFYDQNIYISDKLKTEIEKSELSGLIIKPADAIRFV